MRAPFRLALVTAMAVAVSAHVGSPDAWFEGPAGPYTVTVHIEAPAVVPGIAVVNVRADSSIERVTAFVNTFDAEGATPPPDELLPAADRPGWRRARLWVMNAGSNRVTIEVRGPQGPGSVVVPLAAVALRRLAITPTFVVLIIVVGGVLMTGMLTLVGAAVREGVLDPGAVPDELRRRRARTSMTRAAGVIILVLVGMRTWWSAEDRAFRERMFRPLDVSTRIDTSSGARRFVLAITDSSWLARDEVEVLRARGELPVTGLVDDHGKLMHLFLVSEDGRTAMAHLHPETQDTATFAAVLPPVPAGTYRVFADIVHASGFTQTLTSSVNVPLVSAAAALTDVDDSWARGAAPDSTRVTLDDGTVLTWLRDVAAPVHAGEEAGLRFSVERPAGDTASLQSYLGMRGHAVVVRNDGRVFIHLHPMGTISPAAQARLSPASASLLSGVDHLSPTQTHAPLHSSPTIPDTLTIHNAIPEPGRYAVWVQLKRNGRILTGSFHVYVDNH